MKAGEHMKIQAKIPFTYLYPEEGPSEKYYWINETGEYESDQGVYFYLFEKKVNARGLFSIAAEYVSIEFDGVLYKNVPINEDDSYGAPYLDDHFDWSVYPFNIYSDGCAANTGGEHIVKVFYNLPIVKLTIENAGENNGGYYVASFDENGILTTEFFDNSVAPGSSPTSLSAGSSVTLNAPIVGKPDYDNYQVAYLPGNESTTSMTNANVYEGVLNIDDITTPECSYAGTWSDNP